MTDEVVILDISSHQSPSRINYDLLAAAVDGVILRAAYGTQILGVPGPDSAFNRHYDEFHRRGIPLGAYHYIVNYASAADQIKTLKQAITGKTLPLGIYIDVELEDGEDPLTSTRVIEYTTLLEKEFGVQGFYASNWCWGRIMGEHTAKYSHWILWCAAYTSKVLVPPGWDNWTIWQYTSSGNLPGYGRALDLNKFNGSREQFDAWVQKKPFYPLFPMVYYWQKDPRWAAIKLGTSDVTIGGYGCLISSVASVLTYWGKDVNPAQLNDGLNKVGGYQSGNLLKFDAIEKLYPDIKMDWVNYFATGITKEKIDAILATDHPVIVQVDYHPATPVMDQHWVVILGKSAKGYTIMDPITGKCAEFSERYGDPKDHVYRIVTYTKIEEEAPVLFQAKCLIDNLLIRKTPEKTLVNMVGKCVLNKVYDVFEEKNGYYRIGTSQWASADPAYMQKIDPNVPTDHDILMKMWTWFKVAHPEL